MHTLMKQGNALCISVACTSTSPLSNLVSSLASQCQVDAERTYQLGLEFMCMLQATASVSEEREGAKDGVQDDVLRYNRRLR